MDKKIISTIARKGDEVEYPIGTAPRFISATRQSNFNNLEEELLIGAESLSETYIDNATGNIVIKKEFHNNKDNENIDNNYYLLETRISSTGGTDASIVYEAKNKQLTFSPKNDIQTVFIGGEEPYPEKDTVYFTNSSDVNIEGDTVNFYPNHFVITQQDKLYFVKDRVTDDKIQVVTKIVNKKVDNNKTIIKEQIINHLKNEGDSEWQL